MEYNLKKGSMAFQLKDGNILWISKEDCEEIALKVIVESIVKGNIKAVKNDIPNSEKAAQLYKIMVEQKDMDINIKHQYQTQILNLLSMPELQLQNDSILLEIDKNHTHDGSA